MEASWNSRKEDQRQRTHVVSISEIIRREAAGASIAPRIRVYRVIKLACETPLTTRPLHRRHRERHTDKHYINMEKELSGQ